ncbi:MAG: beta strand repeat-containing protein [Tepidisphaerales bacterium]
MSLRQIRRSQKQSASTNKGCNAPTECGIYSGIGRAVKATMERLEGRVLLSVALQNGVLTVNGTSANDQIALSVDAGDATLLDVVVNGALQATPMAAGVNQIQVNGLAGDDTLTIDVSHGNPIPVGGIAYDGGDGFDSLAIAGSAPASTAYTPGPGGGTIVVASGGVSGTVTATNIEPVLDMVPGPLTVNANNGNNTINYMVGSSPSNGLVSIDNQEHIEFSNKVTLTINGLAGADTINLNNPNTPTGLTSITVDGGDPTAGAGDVLIANGTSGTDAINYSPTGIGSGAITGAGPVPITFSNIEQADLNGQGGNDTLTVTGTPGNDTFTVIPGVSVDSGTVRVDSLVALTYEQLGATGSLTLNGNSGTDTLVINGTAASDLISVAGTTGTVTLNSDVPILQTSIANLVLNGDAGTNAFNLAGGLPYAATTLNGAATVQLNGATGPVTVTLADSTLATNTTITGYGGTVTLAGVDAAGLDANGNTMTVVGTSQNDQITCTPSGPAAGTFQNAGLNTVFSVTNVVGNLTVSGGSGGTADEVIVQGSPGRDLFQINQATTVATVMANDVTSLLPVQLGPNVPVLTANGLGGQDTFEVIPGSGAQININGGTPATANALVIGSTFAALGSTMGTLSALQFVVVDRGLTPDSGFARVFSAAVQNPDVNYTDIATVLPQAGGASLNPNLLVLGPDTYEPNDSQGNAAVLGSAATFQIRNASIFPGSFENPGLPADQDYYQVVAQNTGTLDFQVYFKDYSAALLPGGGKLNLQVFDSAGNPVASATGTTPGTNFGAVGTAANARIRIPAVEGQSYFLRVFGASGNAINGYNATIINTAAPVPANLMLSPADVASHNVAPTIYLRLDDATLLNDLPGNQTPGTPIGVAAIPIPFNPATTIATAAPGYRIAVYDGGSGSPVTGATHTLDPNDPTFIGFAQPVAGVPHLYALTIGSQGADILANGAHSLTARVQIVDPSGTTATGFGGHSGALQVTAQAAVTAPTGKTISGRKLQTISNALVATFTDSNPLATTSEFTATINWGDGTHSAGTLAKVAGIFQVLGTHRYLKQGTYKMTVTVHDTSGPATTIRSTAKISA